MPIYSFRCDDCKATKEFIRPIKEGPPKGARCASCGKNMYLEMNCSFVLRGPGWPGKEIKSGSNYYQEEKEREKWDKENHEITVIKKEHAEILKHRRMGSKASRKHKEENKKMWERYAKRKPHAPKPPKRK